MGYRNILKSVRTELPVKQYKMGFSINGDVPDWLIKKLPLFGSDDGDETYLNSGGRGFLIENGTENDNQVYRIKGTDPKGVITRRVASSEKNFTADIRSSLSECPDADLIEEGLNRRRLDLPSYHGRPFGILTQENVDRSRAVFNTMREEYGRKGLHYPLTFSGSVQYPGIVWGDEPVHSIIFELGRIEDDLRMNEITRRFIKYLNHASIDQLKDIMNRYETFYKKLAKWHAFECRIMTDYGFIPHNMSMLGQNHTISRVSDGNLGLIRVDHTSTEINRLGGNHLFKSVNEFVGELSAFSSMVRHAVEMYSNGDVLDQDRFSNYFDAAHKFYSGDCADYIETTAFVVNFMEEFHGFYMSNAIPEPMEESGMVSLYNDITSIEINQDFERRRLQKHKDFHRKLKENPEFANKFIARGFPVDLNNPLLDD